MIEIQNINFKLKTIDNVKCSYGNVKDIQMSMIRNTFTVHVNYNEGETFTTEYKKPKENDTIEEVNMNISCMVKEVKDEIQEELKEHEEELKEHEDNLKKNQK
jgi:gas vesicle protein